MKLFTGLCKGLSRNNMSSFAGFLAIMRLWTDERHAAQHPYAVVPPAQQSLGLSSKDEVAPEERLSRKCP